MKKSSENGLEHLKASYFKYSSDDKSGQIEFLTQIKKICLGLNQTEQPHTMATSLKVRMKWDYKSQVMRKLDFCI